MFAIPYFLESARDLEIIGVVLGLVFWYQMLKICATREPNSAAKYGWMLFMIFVPGLGALTYFFVRVLSPRE